MATIRDVANLAGVSTTTVSYALNKPDRVTDELRLRVEEAVRALNRPGAGRLWARCANCADWSASRQCRDCFHRP
jgi:hypothetical protein